MEDKPKKDFRIIKSNWNKELIPTKNLNIVFSILSIAITLIIMLVFFYFMSKIQTF